MASNAAGKKATDTLDIDKFTGDPRIVACLKKLDDKFGAAGPAATLVVSDVLDQYDNQYVNLVQKGGGVLGVALVGYTYILEIRKIRFLRLAGTSAGAINTSLMTVIDRKEDPKSEKILKCLCDLNFFDLVDGHPVARWVIKNFITHKNFSGKVKKWLLIIASILAFLFLGDFVLLGLQHTYHWMSVIARFFFVFTGFYLLFTGVVIAYIASLFKRLKNSGYGINPGDYFYDWIKTELAKNKVTKVSELRDKAGQEIPGVKLRVDHELKTTGLKGDVTFITSELVTENKIQFPEMAHLFRKKDEIDNLQPAGFIRASMSIPIFFESYFINDIPCTDKDIKAAWLDKFNEPDPPSTARFVDGGILSNFPINIFYNKDIEVPRLPTFGIDLDDSQPENKEKNAAGWTLSGYFGRMFNTIRFYYDKDFLLKNKRLEMGIGKVPLSQYNWLNFFLKDQEKIDMFVAGAETATEFLINFDWNDYKNNRTRLYHELK